jgi:multidrug efflux pump subunit AcrA (membrane-fusion protein)
MLIVFLAAAGYFAFRVMTNKEDGLLRASGTIEAIEVNVSPETSGKVKEVLVNEGQTVKAGDPLLRLDDILLTAQRAVASAQVDTAKVALATAQYNYNLTLQNAMIAQQASTANNWRFSAPDQFNQPGWYFNQTEQIASAQAALDTARKALEDAQANLEKVTSDINNADFVSAETRLANARAMFLLASDVKKQAEFAAQSGGLLDAAYDNYNAALDELNAAQAAYNALLNTESAKAVLDARGKLAVAQQQYEAAFARLAGLQTGTQSPVLTAASNALDQAKAGLAQAQANLDLLDKQMSKLTIYAPMDGVVLARNVEPGEFVQPGADAFTMANLGELTITVYVPEDRYGQLHLGQTVNVTVDSFKGKTFTATVTYISDQAEFTPRNVQTVAGRSATVYAIKLKVSDPNGELKLGMPADVVFVQ